MCIVKYEYDFYAYRGTAEMVRLDASASFVQVVLAPYAFFCR